MTATWIPLGSQPVPPLVEGQWLKVQGGAMVWSGLSTYSATPPASPNDGDIWDFPADATAGVIWRFRYRAASASTYKWEFVGGPPLRSVVAAQETAAPAPGIWVDLATLGPSVTVPRAGDYDCDLEANMTHSSISVAVYIGICTGATSPDSATAITTPQALHMSYLRHRFRYPARAAGAELRQRYAQGTAGTLYAITRQLTVTPVRVS